MLAGANMRLDIKYLRRRTSSMMRFWLVDGSRVACSPTEDVDVMMLLIVGLLKR